MPRIVPLGDRAYLAKFDDEGLAARWGAAASAAGFAWIEEVVVAYRSVAVFVAPGIVEWTEVERLLGKLNGDGAGGAETSTASKRVSIPVLYDGEDLGYVSEQTGLTREEVIEAHSTRDYRVFAVGFLPGFPYAGYLPPPLDRLPRRAVPRVRVPAGSVAIAGRQTGVYPTVSAGGWRLLGRTPLRLADFESGRFPIQAGDTLRFVPIGLEEFQAREGEFP